MSWVLISRGRFLTVVGGLSFILVGVVARLHYWQVSSGSAMAAEARDGRDSTQIEKARRGDILDRNGAILAASKARITLGCDPTAIPFDEIAKPVIRKSKGKPDVTEPPLQDQLAAVLKIKTSELLELLKPSASGRPVKWRVLRDSLNEVEYAKVKSLKIKGIYGNRRYERVYPQESLACHILGFVNKEEMPSSGVESFLDYYLKGTDGWIESNHDALRREIYHHREREVPAQAGFNVELTLDAGVQSYIEEEVAAIVAKFSPLGVSIIVSDPTNAEVLGLANYPNYNPNEFWKAPLEAQKNRAVTDIYEPGSTFKIVAIAAALETGLTTVNSFWDCAKPTVLLNGKEVDLPDDHHPLGRITLDQVIAKSSNRGSALIGCQLGGQKLYDYCRAFGFGETTGFGFGGEVRGILAHPSKWDGKTITRLPIGHSVSATPMQVHTAMGVIASGGFLLSPHVVRRVSDSDGNSVLEATTAPRRRVISETTAKSMAWMLAKVVQPGGTATQADIKGYDAVGKTGTTQKIVNGHYSRAHHVASFSGFFPSAHPRLLITITVDEPHGPGVGYGGLVAAPSFKSLSEKLIPYLKIPPAPGSELTGLNIAHDR